MKKKQSKIQNHSFNKLLLLLCVFATLGFTSSSFSQNIVVKGKVTDKAGVPLPGATVTVKNQQTIGVQTDFEGSFIPLKRQTNKLY